MIGLHEMTECFDTKNTQLLALLPSSRTVLHF